MLMSVLSLDHPDRHWPFEGRKAAVREQKLTNGSKISGAGTFVPAVAFCSTPLSVSTEPKEDNETFPPATDWN
jgi:hypothetical protein